MSRLFDLDSTGREATRARSLDRREVKATHLQAFIIVALAAFVVLGFGLRLRGLDQVGFAEDEVNKLEAVRAYERGDISPNAEHPMLMKSLMYVSMRAAHAWNASASSSISDEVALRLPNVLFGALTVVPIFLLTAAFFDRRTALTASALWAFGLNAVTYNRVAKEDTLLVFFMLFGFYFFIRAKQTSGFEPKPKRWYYGLSGVSFGLMLASKYFPHYLGLNMLYQHLFRVREREPNEPPGRTPKLFYLLIGLAFLIANPAVLLPQTWQYMTAYAGERLLTHTGYLMGEHLYRNNASATPFAGTPFYFYLLFLTIKVPLPILAALVLGLVRAVRRWRHPGHAFLLMMFILWVVPYSLMGAKWLRYTLSLMPFVYMLASIGIISLVQWTSASLRRFGAERAKVFASVLIMLVFILLPAQTAYSSGPHYAAYLNPLGGARTGYFFPHDEFYDDGLREAIQFICERAPQGASIANDTPAVFRYYLEKYGRKDLQSRPLSDAGFKVEEASQPTYVMVQRGRTYFENREKMSEARARGLKVYEGRVRGVIAVEVFRL